MKQLLSTLGAVLFGTVTACICIGGYAWVEDVDTKWGEGDPYVVGSDSWYRLMERNLPTFGPGELIIHHECDKCGEYSIIKMPDRLEYGVTVYTDGHVDAWVIEYAPPVEPSTLEL